MDMNKIFCAPKRAFASSFEMLNAVLRSQLNISDYTIVKNENGKPFLSFFDSSLPQIFISITHTTEYYFIAFCDENVGIDAEPSDRKPNYLPVLSKFSVEEREEIKNTNDFLKYWTIKESAIKWLGGSIAVDLKKLVFTKGKLLYKNIELPVKIVQKEIFSHIVSVCAENTNDWEFIFI